VLKLLINVLIINAKLFILSDTPSQDSPTICAWMMDVPQSCIVIFMSNPLSDFVALNKDDKQLFSTFKFKFSLFFCPFK